jgi:dolichol kinase
VKKAAPTDQTFRSEVIRKGIHLLSVVIPILYFLTPRYTALMISALLTILALALDLTRNYYPPFATRFNVVFGRLLRRHESDPEAKRLNGGTYVLIAATLSILIFPKLIAITAFIVLIVSDLSAALVGSKFGRTPFLGKSLEGSLAFFLSGLVVMAATPKIEYLAGEYAIGVAALLAGTIVEALPVEVDDNLSVPLTVGLTMWGGYALFYPLMDLYNKFG